VGERERSGEVKQVFEGVVAGQGAEDQPAAGAVEQEGDGDRGPAGNHKGLEVEEQQQLCFRTTVIDIHA
jgi:hypothetical protein